MKVGDKVYVIDTFTRKFQKSLSCLDHPQERKITQIVPTKTGNLYQISDGHFHENSIGEWVFLSKEEAQQKIDQKKAELSKIVKRYVMTKN